MGLRAEGRIWFGCAGCIMSFLALNQLTTQGFTDWKEPLMSRAARIFACALALTLSLASIDARADEPESQDPVVFWKGLRARIADGKLRSAKLAFTESAVTVQLNPGISERFEFGQLRVRRGQHRMNLPLIDGWYWLSLSPSIAISIATGGSATVLNSCWVHSSGYMRPIS